MIREKLMRFMYGRYGNDQLNKALMVLFFIIWGINLFAGTWILYAIGMLILAFEIYRTFSRRIPARQRENRAWLKIWGSVKHFFSGLKMRVKDFKTFRYRKCPSCKATLRLPRSRGKHTARCPKCGNEFSVKIII